MKCKYILIIICFIIFIQNLNAITKAIEIDQGDHLIIDDNVNFRKMPSIDSMVISKLNKGEIINVINKTYFSLIKDGIQDYFYKVKYKGQIGYVFGLYISDDEIFDFQSDILYNIALKNIELSYLAPVYMEKNLYKEICKNNNINKSIIDKYYSFNDSKNQYGITLLESINQLYELGTVLSDISFDKKLTFNKFVVFETKIAIFSNGSSVDVDLILSSDIVNAKPFINIFSDNNFIGFMMKVDVGLGYNTSLNIYSIKKFTLKNMISLQYIDNFEMSQLSFDYIFPNDKNGKKDTIIYSGEKKIKNDTELVKGEIKWDGNQFNM